MSRVVDEHRQYLADDVRLSAYQKAIQRVVRPGDVVLDLASGTGVLGLLACQAGAERVYSVEVGSIIELAREICRANGFQERVVFLKGHSSQLELPEKVDVVVSDQIGHFGFEAGLVQNSRDAERRFLKPGGSMIPLGVRLHLAAFEYPELFERIEFWESPRWGLDLKPARAIAANTGYPTMLAESRPLGAPVVAGSFELFDAPTSLELMASIVATESGTLHGIGGWFSARLAEGVEMTNSPFAEVSINRRRVFFPIDHPVDVFPGDRIEVRMRVLPTDLIVLWKVEVKEKRGDSPGAQERVKAVFSHSTFRGMLLSREDLQRTDPGFSPELTPWGRARLSVLRSCDEGKNLSEVEQDVFDQHADLFPSSGEAARFVAEVVTRYAR